MVISCLLLVVGSRYDFFTKITRTDGCWLSVVGCLLSVLDTIFWQKSLELTVNGCLVPRLVRRGCPFFLGVGG